MSMPSNGSPKVQTHPTETEDFCQLQISYNGQLLTICSQFNLIQWHQPKSNPSTFESPQQLLVSIRDATVPTKLFLPTDTARPSLPAVAGISRESTCTNIGIVTWEAKDVRKIDVVLGVQDLLRRLSLRTDDTFRLNPGIYDLELYGWMEGVSSEVKVFNSHAKRVFKVPEASQGQLASIVTAGVVGTGLVGALGYYKFGGKQAVEHAVSEEETKAYSTVRVLDRARERLLALKHAATSHGLEGLREKLADIFEDVGDVLELEEDTLFEVPG